MEELKNLFVKAGVVFKLFSTTMNGVIVFDTDVQSETELLTKSESNSLSLRPNDFLTREISLTWL